MSDLRPPATRRDQIEHNFTYRPPSVENVTTHTQVRAKARELALLIVELTIPSREQSLALTTLEQSRCISSKPGS